MKKTIFFTLCLSAFITFSAAAKIWRVNNNPGVNADFTTIQAAHDAAIAGDTIHVEPSLFTYGDLIATKKLIILGNGYFLNENTNNQSNIGVSILGAVKFKTGSSNSQIIGLDIEIIRFENEDVVDGVLIERNHFTGSTIIGGIGTGAISFDVTQFSVTNNTTSNIIIRKNYIEGGIIQNCSFTNCSVNALMNLSNILILNNYISESVWLSGATQCTNSGIIANNIVQGQGIIACGFTIENNILTSTSYENEGTVIYLASTNSISHNNIISASHILYPEITSINTNNMFSVDPSTIFVGITNNTTDSQWHLKPSSPALGFGTNGVDCGIFGGVNPYQIAGLPSIPSVYLLNAPASNNTTTLPVTISVKSNN